MSGLNERALLKMIKLMRDWFAEHYPQVLAEFDAWYESGRKM